MVLWKPREIKYHREYNFKVLLFIHEESSNKGSDFYLNWPFFSPQFLKLGKT